MRTERSPALGTFGGLWPEPRRPRKIRSLCNQLLGIAAVPMLEPSLERWSSVVAVADYPGRFDRVSVGIYLAMGWSGVMLYNAVVRALPRPSGTRAQWYELAAISSRDRAPQDGGLPRSVHLTVSQERIGQSSFPTSHLPLSSAGLSISLPSCTS